MKSKEEKEQKIEKVKLSLEKALDCLPLSDRKKWVILKKVKNGYKTLEEWKKELAEKKLT